MFSTVSDGLGVDIDGEHPLVFEIAGKVQAELKETELIFLDENRFKGCAGLTVTDEMRLTIAGQACLHLLNRETDYYPTLKTILLYPSSYQHPERGGESDSLSGATVLGESWQYGPVVLSRDSTRRGAINHQDGKNVVLHEFAHQLDQIDGSADGAPSLGRGLSLNERFGPYKIWSSVFQKEFQDFQRKAEAGRKTVIDHYGATNPAEFFATATEAFFEKPRQLQKKRPDVYDQLKGFYRLDPVNWTQGSGGEQ